MGVQGKDGDLRVAGAGDYVEACSDTLCLARVLYEASLGASSLIKRSSAPGGSLEALHSRHQRGRAWEGARRAERALSGNTKRTPVRRRERAAIGWLRAVEEMVPHSTIHGIGAGPLNADTPRAGNTRRAPGVEFLTHKAEASATRTSAPAAMMLG